MDSVPGVMALGWTLGAWQVARHAWPDGVLDETPLTVLHQLVIGAFIGIYGIGLVARSRRARPAADDLGEIRQEVSKLHDRVVFREDWTSLVGAAAQHHQDELAARRQHQHKYHQIKPPHRGAS